MKRLVIGLGLLLSLTACGANSTTPDNSGLTSMPTTSAAPSSQDFNYVINVMQGNTLDVTTDKGLPAIQLDTAYDQSLQGTVTRWGINDKPSVHVTGTPAFCVIATKTGSIVSEIKKTSATDLTCYVP
jgi:hypothetical protein